MEFQTIEVHNRAQFSVESLLEVFALIHCVLHSSLAIQYNKLKLLDACSSAFSDKNSGHLSCT